MKSLLLQSEKVDKRLVFVRSGYIHRVVNVVNVVNAVNVVNVVRGVGDAGVLNTAGVLNAVGALNTADTASVVDIAAEMVVEKMLASVVRDVLNCISYPLLFVAAVTVKKDRHTALHNVMEGRVFLHSHRGEHRKPSDAVKANTAGNCLSYSWAFKSGLSTSLRYSVCLLEMVKIERNKVVKKSEHCVTRQQRKVALYSWIMTHPASLPCSTAITLASSCK